MLMNGIYFSARTEVLNKIQFNFNFHVKCLHYLYNICIVDSLALVDAGK